MLNTLKYAKILQDVGFSRDQAETSIQVLIEVMEDKLATKQDLQALESRLSLATRELELKLTLRMGALLAASVTLQTAIITAILSFHHWHA